MTSPYVTGGGGTQFETQVAADFLAAMLCELPARGLAGRIVTSIKTQRADLGAPLDDLIIGGEAEDGLATSLHLQITNTCTFTAGDGKWIDVLGRAWATFKQDEFDRERMRLGVGIGRYTATADDHYQSVLLWARYSATAEDFFQRLEMPDFSTPRKSEFVRTIRDALKAHAGAEIGQDDLWAFLKCLVIIHFDFQNADTSRDREGVLDRLRRLFEEDADNRARQLWDHLLTQAARLIPSAGSLDRTALRQRMRDGGFAFAEPSSTRRRAIQAIDRESRRALAEIKSDIAGLRLHRKDASTKVREALASARFIQIVGEPGAGKSALLKDFAEEFSRQGAVFVLKDARVHPRGWAAHADVLGVSADCAELLSDLAGAGESILFIDGIDKIVDPEMHVTVNDIFRTIAASPHLSGWRILVTVREQNQKHLETWIDRDVLDKLSLATIALDTLNDEEVVTVAAKFSRLAGLILQQPVALILRRPFFLNALLRLPNEGDALPETEVRLMELWWSFGGTDQTQTVLAQEQREVLIELATRLAHKPGQTINPANLSPSAIDRLLGAGILRRDALGNTLVFGHDIYEEWSLCQCLIRIQPEVVDFIRTSGEAELLLRPLQLLGTALLELQPSSADWERLIEAVSDPGLRSVWQRSVLLSSLQSLRSSALLGALSTYLLAGEGQALIRLLQAVKTIEVVPDYRFLNEQLIPGIEAHERPKFANLQAKPRILVWVRLLDWLMPIVNEIPRPIIPSLLDIFLGWQEFCAGAKVRHCREIGEKANEWIGQFVDDSFPPRKTPEGLVLSYEERREFITSLRKLLLLSGAVYPQGVTAYLQGIADNPRKRRIDFEAVLNHLLPLAQHLPVQLVDFMLTAMVEHPERSSGGNAKGLVGYRPSLSDDSLGIASDRLFYPASPLRPPFLYLLRNHPDEGLRLIHGLCNHALSVWRWERQHSYRHARSTPLPIVLTWEGRSREYWGDRGVYLWFRGVWGSKAVQCALMALEMWAFEMIENGAPFNEVFDKVLGDNQSVAILGLATSLCLAHPHDSCSRSAPLVTCSHLWGWDIERLIGDYSPTNTMADWHRHGAFLNAVKALNERPHRRRDVRDLIPALLLSGDKELQQRILADISAFPQNLPFDYEEQKADSDFIEAQSKRMAVFAENGDLDNWRMARQGDKVAIWCELPSSQTEASKEEAAEHTHRQEHIELSLWAHSTLENNELDTRCTMEDGWKRAKDVEANTTYQPFDVYDAETRLAAIGGVAFVLSRYSDDEEALDWAATAFERLLHTPDFLREGSLRSMVIARHPKLFAIHGLSQLLARDRHVALAQRELSQAVFNIFEKLAGTVFLAMTSYVVKYPVFSWTLIDLAMRRSISTHNCVPDVYRVVPERYEIDAANKLLRRADRALARGQVPQLPIVPWSWKKEPWLTWRKVKEKFSFRKKLPYFDGVRLRSSQDPRRGYLPNKDVFLWHLAEALIFNVPVGKLADVPGGADRMYFLASQLRDFTIAEIAPPFADPDDRHGSGRPIKWMYSFSYWLGIVLAELPGEAVKKKLLEPVLQLKGEVALQFLHPAVRSFMIAAFIRRTDHDPANLFIWRKIAAWLLGQAQPYDASYDHLDRDVTFGVISLFFCASRDFGPLSCLIPLGWKNDEVFTAILDEAVIKLGPHSSVFTCLIRMLDQAGEHWLPEPGLGWIEGIAVQRKLDLRFWEGHGEDTVSLLKSIIANHQHAISDEVRRRIIRIADLLVDGGVVGAGFLQQELIRLSIKNS